MANSINNLQELRAAQENAKRRADFAWAQLSQSVQVIREDTRDAFIDTASSPLKIIGIIGTVIRYLLRMRLRSGRANQAYAASMEKESPPFTWLVAIDAALNLVRSYLRMRNRSE